MTFEGIKQSLVEEQKLLDNKGLKRLCLNTALCFLTFGADVSLVIVPTIGPSWALIGIIGLVFLYLDLLTICTTDEKVLRRTQKLSKLWFLGIILFIALYVLLRMVHWL